MEAIHKYRILVADDEPIERMVVCKTIQSYFEEELEIVQATNGREAVEAFEKEECQIVLLDISMPGINGLEAAEKIREMDMKCKIIFLTAYDDFDYAQKAIRVKAMDYLLKPSRKEELIAVLEEAVNEISKGQEASKSIETEEVYKEEDGIDQVKSQILAERIRKYIDEHYMEDICLQDAASSLHYSDAYFCKFFKQNFDKSFIVYLSELRMEKAKELLEDCLINVKDVSQKVGYRDSNYFTKVFKRITGLTPSEYRIQKLQESAAKE